MSTYVKKVHFKLHESYNNPNRIVTKPPYELTETGWGEFEIMIKIYFHDPNERPVSKHFTPGREENWVLLVFTAAIMYIYVN
jgi:YEATS domain-containing protein 4